MKVRRVLFLISLIKVLISVGYAQKANIILIGESSDTTVKFVIITKPAILWHDFTGNKQLVKTAISGNKFEINYSLYEIGLIDFQILGQTIEVISQPGDSLSFSIKKIDNKRQVIFQGKNAALYNYDQASKNFTKSTLGFIYPRYNKNEGISVYKSKLDNWFDKKNSFLDSFKKENRLVDNVFEYLRDDISNQYIYSLYSTLVINKIGKEQLPSNYFAKVNVMPKHNMVFPSENAILAFTYRNILSSIEEPFNHFAQLFASIKNNYTGIDKQYFLADLIGVFSKKQNDKYHNELLKGISDAKLELSDTNCLNYITRCELDYKLLDRPIPDYVKTTTFLLNYKTGLKISLADFFKIYADQAMYVDFWANWCTACRIDIANSSTAKTFLADNKVAYIYISIDRKVDIIKWRSAAKNDNIEQDQFLLVDGIASPLGKFINLQSIPRYLIFNGMQQLKNYDAPRPVPNQLVDLKMAISTSIVEKAN